MGDFIEQEGLLPGNHQNANFVDVCEICGVKKSNFKNSLLYLEHYKKHKNPQEQCSIWKKICGTKYQVLKHKHNVHGQIHRCKQCQREFGTKGNLSRHEAGRF